MRTWAIYDVFLCLLFQLRVHLDDVFSDAGGYSVNPFFAASIRDDIGRDHPGERLLQCR